MTLTKRIDNTTEGVKGSLLERDQYIRIWGFMLADLKLAKTELMVYAVIFSMYKYNFDDFSGSRTYLQAWCNSGKTAIDNALASLVKKQLITKGYRQFGNVRVATYGINPDMLPECEMFENENRYQRAKERYEQRKAQGEG